MQREKNWKRKRENIRIREREVTKPHAEREELEKKEGKYQNKRERGHKAACREKNWKRKRENIRIREREVTKLHAEREEEEREKISE